MNRYEEIKTLLEASRKVLTNRIDEQVNSGIKNYYGILKEQDEKIEEPKEPEYETANTDTEDNDDEVVKKTEKKRAYRVSGGIIVIHGKDKQDSQLTTDDKKAFQETMDEFVTEVSELVDFNKLNLYENNVEWSGKITELDVEFFYSIGENNGIYVNGAMTKIDDEYLGFLVKLRKYYEKFKSKWSKVIAIRKKTPEA
jgi:hypothetical protein